jgi:hypothetical protein
MSQEVRVRAAQQVILEELDHPWANTIESWIT